MRTVVALYSKSSTIVDMWLGVGFHAVLVDLQHREGEHTEGNVTRIGADMLEWTPPRWLAKSDVAFVAAFPPCDHLAVSGARWFAGKGLGKLAYSIQLFQRAAHWCEWFEAPYMIENPVSTISSYWRKPDHIFHPWQFNGFCRDDHYTKKTCLWTGNGFVMPEWKLDVSLDGIEPDNRIHAAPPSDDRADFRSATPRGFSQAVFKANWTDKVFGKSAA